MPPIVRKLNNINASIVTTNPVLSLTRSTIQQRAGLKNNNETVEAVVTNNPYFKIAQATKKRRNELIVNMRRHKEKYNESIKRLEELNKNPYKLSNKEIENFRKTASNRMEKTVKTLENLNREIKSLRVDGGKRRTRRRKQV